MIHELTHHWTAYIGRDYPIQWPLELDPVQLAFEDHTVHYALSGETAVKEWQSLLPSGGVTVRLGSSFRPFTVSVFHQLRCLDVVRDAMVEYRANGMAPSAKARHCLNYLRQMTLCRANTRLENVRDSSEYRHKVTVSEVTYTCRDWSAVIEAAEDNWKTYVAAK